MLLPLALTPDASVKFPLVGNEMNSCGDWFLSRGLASMETTLQRLNSSLALLGPPSLCYHPRCSQGSLKRLLVCSPYVYTSTSVYNVEIFYT